MTAARILAFAVLLFAAGCVNPKTDALLEGIGSVPVAATDIAGNHAIFVTTTRAWAEKDERAFDRGRSSVLNYARVNVTVPKAHKAGQIELKKRGKPDDPSKYFMATDFLSFDAQPQFSRALDADIAARGGRVMLFVHGYNTAFDAAVFRMTQIAHDSGYGGTPVLFSWSSGGKTTDYVYDRESASVARDQLEATMRLLAQSGARRIDIIAHSMGTWITMEALRQLAITGDRDLGGKLGDVVLASPDIDVDVFKSQMRRYGKPAKPFFLLLSGDDRALKLSGILAGSQPRLGGYSNAAELAEYGVQVVDMSKVKAGDSLNHTKFADNPELVRLLGQRLREDDGFASDREITDRLRQMSGS